MGHDTLEADDLLGSLALEEVSLAEVAGRELPPAVTEAVANPDAWNIR